MRSEEASSRKLGRRAAKGLFKGGGTSVFFGFERVSCCRVCGFRIALTCILTLRAGCFLKAPKPARVNPKSDTNPEPSSPSPSSALEQIKSVVPSRKRYGPTSPTI